MTKYDAIIVGGGHNGLVCGAYLAKAGKRVLVLERCGLIGGAAVSEEIWPGFRVSTASYVMALLQPRIILELELKRLGLEIIPAPPIFVPLPEGDGIYMHSDPDTFAEELARISPTDARAYPAYRAHMATLSPILQRVIWERPPDVSSRRPRDLAAMAGLAWRYRDIGSRFYDLLDVMTLSTYDFLSRWFEDDRVKAILGYYSGGGGGNGSPKTPGTAYTALRPLVRDHSTPAGGPGFVRGGMGGISNAIAAAGIEHGMEVRTDAEVASVQHDDHRVSGVTLASGERFQADVVAVNAAAATALPRLLKMDRLPPAFATGLRNFRSVSTAFKVNMAVDRLPDYSGFDRERAGFDYPVQTRIGCDTSYLEAAFDAAKAGEIPQAPLLTVMAPSVVDDTLAPPGRHLLSIFGGHVPYTPAAGDWESARPQLLEAVVSTIERHAPGFRGSVVDAQVLAPPDLEARFGLPGGHVHHGELTLDQTFFRRPAPGWSGYAMPLEGLYLCSASAHPGGGVTGVPGHNAAKAILEDRR